LFLRIATTRSDCYCHLHAPTVVARLVVARLVGCSGQQQQSSYMPVCPNMVSIRLTQDEMHHLLEEQGNVGVRCCLQATTATTTGSQVAFDYLNKGAANVIFKIRPELNSSAKRFQFVDVSPKDKLSGVATPVAHQNLMGTVLRVPRGGQKHLSSLEILDGFEHAIRPLFLPGTCTKTQLDRDLTKHLMDHEGVLLFPEVMNHLYTRVEKLTFANTQSQRKCWGILLPDMSLHQDNR